MDDLASTLLVALKKSSSTTDSKLDLFNRLKSGIKHQNIPESAQPATFECIRLAIISQTSSSLVAAGLSTFVHLNKRLKCQDSPDVLNTHVSKFIPIFLDRLGDLRENTRIAASQCFCELWLSRPVEVERAIREGALTSSNVRAKEAGIQWVTKMHKDHGLQFRSFVSPLVECLEDAEGSVRDAAKANIIELFSDAPDRAKTDLKKQLTAHGIRYGITSYILSKLAIPGAADIEHKSSMQSNHRVDKLIPAAAHGDHDQNAIQVPPSQTVDRIEPAFVHTSRELEDEFRDMQSCFEGKETEQNWMSRDKNVLRIRRLNQGNAPADFPTAFIAGIKGSLDGVLKVANSLRTTMSTNGCHLLQELARTIGTAMDSMIEIVLQSLIKMCSATKHISAQNGNTTVEVIYSNLPYSVRLMQHVWSACQDKNTQPRSFASGWLKILIKRHGHIRVQFEHTGGLELAEKSIKKGLSDANPKVREGMRGTYWEFKRIWPDRAEMIMSGLDAKSRQLLEKDPGNPNAAAVFATFSSSLGPTNPRAATSSSRTALQEQIAAQRRAAARLLPDRPSSAQSSFSPMKPTATPTTRSHVVQSSASGARVASHPSSKATASGLSSITGQGSLMSAPMRRPKRHEVPRPATADPYASRSNMKDDTSPSRSPVMSPSKPNKKPTSQNGSYHVKSKSTTSISSPLSSVKTPDIKKAAVVHSMGQVRNLHESPVLGKPYSPTVIEEEEDNFTLIMPTAISSIEISKELIHAPKIAADRDLPAGVAEAESVLVYEDPCVQQTAGSPSQPEKIVLEELPLNELPDNDERSSSPPKKTSSRRPEDVASDRAEVLRSRRLLASGIERIRARTLDAHGFRRLQDLVKSHSQDGAFDFAVLLSTLSEYLAAPLDSLKINALKGQNLKTQALGVIRTLLFVHRQDNDVVKEHTRLLCAILLAKREFDSTAHITAELLKTAEQIISSSETPDLLLDDVLGLVESESNTDAADHRRLVTMALSVLSKLLLRVHDSGIILTVVQKQRLGRVAVRFLSDLDADVRRVDTEFCLDLYGILEGPSNNGINAQGGQAGEFWKWMKGAKEQHLNLIAYYIARRSKT